jgi:hypothetical protein
MLKNLAVAIIGGLVIWFVQNHFKDVATATYSISDAIEIPGSQGKTAEYAQEITVLNSGRSSLKAVSIRIPNHISSYKLTKHSNIIKEESISEANSFELVYPELPTGQQLRLLIRYDGNSIDKKWISISHADGNAQPQENKPSPFNYSLIWLAFCLGFVSQSVGDIRRWKRESFIKWSDDEKKFRNDKPWFASSSEWSEMQFEAIDRLISKPSYSSINDSPYYQLLNRSKPEMLSDEHWITLQKNASSSLMTRFSKEVNRYSNTNKLIDLFRLKKPEYLSHEMWMDFQKSLKQQTLDSLLPPHINAAGFVSLLEPKNATLKGLPDSVEIEIRELVQQRYFNYLTDGSKYEISGDPLAVLHSARFDLLTEHQSESVKKNILRLARMKEMPDIWSVDILEIFIAKNRPEWMPEEEFNSISRLVGQAKSLSGQLDAARCNQIEMEKLRQETETVKKRVLAQLNLIDDILLNPDSIDKIEDYDNTFAPGNKKNLQLVASLLKSASNNCLTNCISPV